MRREGEREAGWIEVMSSSFASLSVVSDELSRVSLALFGCTMGQARKFGDEIRRWNRLGLISGSHTRAVAAVARSARKVLSESRRLLKRYKLPFRPSSLLPELCSEAHLLPSLPVFHVLSGDLVSQ